MKRLSACLLLIAALALPARALPMLTNGVSASVDLDGNGVAEIEYLFGASDLTQTDPYFRVSYYLKPGPSSRLIRSAKKAFDFPSGAVVSPSSLAFTNWYEGPWMSLLGFDEHQFKGIEWRYYDLTPQVPDSFYTNKLSVLIGFRADLEDGRHFGWLKFSRPDTTFTTPFTLDAYDWNPVPNAAIGAGLPPEIPLTTELVPEDGSLKLSWPSGASSWILESTADLTPPVEWKPYDGASGTYAIVPLEEAGRYFRLRRQ